MKLWQEIQLDSKVFPSHSSEFGFTLLIALMGFIGFSVFMRDRDSFTKNTIERG